MAFLLTDWKLAGARKTAVKAVLIRDGAIVVEDQPTPEPGPGQVLVKSLACGICGSDLHMLKHGDEMMELRKRSGQLAPDLSTPPDVMLGHELCAEIVGYGPDTRADLATGTRVASAPFLITADGIAGIGTTHEAYGAFSEYFLLNEDLLIAVPDDVPNQAVALAEPLAVGIHAVERGSVSAADAALVVGCGPVGLAVIAALEMRGITNIVASDPVEHRRSLALNMGASLAVNPATDNEIEAVQAASAGQGVAIFECAGVAALIPTLIDRAPSHCRIVFVGVHTQDVTISPSIAMTKELDLSFSFYYSIEEYQEAFQALADGRIKWQPMYTGKVGVDGVADAFETLMAPNDHVKIMVEPWRTGPLETVPPSNL